MRLLQVLVRSRDVLGERERERDWCVVVFWLENSPLGTLSTYTIVLALQLRSWTGGGGGGHFHTSHCHH